MLRTIRSIFKFRRIRLSPSERRLSRCVNVNDLRKLARRLLPRGVFDYIDGGAEDEYSMIKNSLYFRYLEFIPRVLCDVSNVDIRTTVVGQKLAFPLILAPTGFTRVVHPQGELAAARAAGNAGIPCSLSTLGTHSIGEFADAGTGPKWFQVYMWKDRGLVKELTEQAADRDYKALLVTVDVPVFGSRERDIRNGLTLPPKLGLETLVDGLKHPRWTFNFLRGGPITFANVRGSGVPDGSDPVSLAPYINEQFDPSLNWKDIEWLRSLWNGPIVIKGIQSVRDAEIAARVGIEAIALSNHGGRQLDGAPSPVELIAPVADRVGDQLQIICDGGVRRGSDIAKALALGAQACMMGRPYLYGLAVAGERGVETVLDWFQDGLRRTMALIGCRKITELTRDRIRWQRKYVEDSTTEDI